MKNDVLSQKEICFSFDDGEVSPVEGTSFVEWDQQLLCTLEHYRIQSILFTSACYVDNPVGKEIIANWHQSGHIIGNHTQNHLDYNKVEAQEYFNDILRNQQFLSQFSSETKYFRPPYLHGGHSQDKQRELESFLKNQGLVSCGVTIDTSDWYINERLVAALTAGISIERCKEVYRELYLNHLLERVNFYDALARETLEFAPPHVLLLHHNLAAVLFLEDLILLLQQEGWYIQPFQTCLADPFYQKGFRCPIENSLIWMNARESKQTFSLRNPGEGAIYEEHIINQQELRHFKSLLHDI